MQSVQQAVQQAVQSVQAVVTRDEAKLARQQRHERAFADVLHVMAGAGFVAKEYLVVLRLNQTTWNDPRLWAPLVNVKYKHTEWTRRPVEADSDDEDAEIEEGDEEESIIYDETRLHRECRRGRESGVLRLLGLGADVGIANEEGESALTLSSWKGRINLVNALLAAKANVDHADNHGSSSLTMASKEGHVAVVHALIALGAIVDHAENHGFLLPQPCQPGGARGSGASVDCGGGERASRLQRR